MPFDFAYLYAVTWMGKALSIKHKSMTTDCYVVCPHLVNVPSPST